MILHFPNSQHEDLNVILQVNNMLSHRHHFNAADLYNYTFTYSTVFDIFGTKCVFLSFKLKTDDENRILFIRISSISKQPEIEMFVFDAFITPGSVPNQTRELSEAPLEQGIY
ncbi:hypothetical protein GDO78_019642 [Eleutherodactylus coqui]|uniref:Uncharacterized protein n=1 Tax=Eleutherodactylus coqui TaxID=57060 RepID=A0A8J6EJ30_ELECQ|nr:hypothetical protein GDO78_019642 [Eleutherodactylus coqui]